MHIAVVVPAFNVAAYLHETIHSVAGQSHTNWSLIVVDDGSTDETAEVVAGFTDPRIVLLRQAQLGVSAARNRGMLQAEASNPDAFLFLDGDDWLAPDALEVLAAALDNTPSVVAASGRYARVRSDGSMHLSHAPIAGALLEHLLVRNRFANGGHLLIRRSAVQTAGEFRRDLRYGEDWEYWTRLALVGEFVAADSRAPVLFVRERAGSVYISHATDPDVYRPAMQTIYGNPTIAECLGQVRLAGLRRRAEAEIAWTVGRELIRHGKLRDGKRWLRRSLHGAPSLKRLALTALVRVGRGPFRPYQTSA